MKIQIKMHSRLRLLILFACTLLLAPTVNAKGVEKSKKVSKVFKATTKQVLDIENKFGDVDITTWDKMEIQLDISVTVDQKNEDKAQKLLDEISIEISESADLIKIKTELDKDNVSKKVDGKNKMEINYTLKMPANMALELENQFGDVTLDKLDARTKIEVQFGTAKIGKLSTTDNELTFKFSDPVIIDEIGGGEIELRFSKLDLGRSGSLDLDSQMSTVKLGETGNGDLKVSYGSLDLESIPDLKLKASMSSVTIGKMLDGGDINVQYGKLHIKQLSKSFKGLDISGSFTPITIEVEDGAAFELDANTSMSDLDLPSGYKVVEGSEFTKNESFDGIIGSKGEGLPIMKVKNSFGKIEIR